MRSLVAAFLAALSKRASPADRLDCHFRVLPWEVGISTFKSDRYFTVADLAQVDFGVRVGLMSTFVRDGIRWVNLAQSARFERPLRLFQRYTVETSVVCTDDKHAYFSHRFSSPGQTHAEVLVKAKFKLGSRTIAPAELLGQQPSLKPPEVVALDSLSAARPTAR